MRLAPKRLWIVLAVVSFAGILKATLPQITIGSWTATSSLSQARSNGAAALLPSGRILFTGGDSGSGPVQSAEYFGADGAVSSAAPMNYPRSGHFAVVLSDGRVLVGGGNSSGGGTTNSAEVYDPSSDSWTKTSAMAEARANGTAALLQDGRVLIAGGDNAGAPNNTVEIYDPSSGNFSVAGTLSSARTKQSMAVLQDGRVLIAGGFDGNNPLASSDIFDPSSGNVSAGPALSTARYSASATTLLNGQVAIIGGAGSDGNGGTTDLASIEIFDASSNSFHTVSAALATARQAHQAYLLPNNNNVLIAGGTSGGNALASSELFTAQTSSVDGSWSYSVSPTGAMTTARAAASGAVNQQNGPTSKVTPRPGLVIAGGGADGGGNTLASTEAYGYDTVQTDQGDYPPGTTVNITGSGFTPGETVTITLVESPLFDTHGPYTVTADGNGNISDSSFTTDTHDENIRFFLSAVGTQSGVVAQNTFTDGNATSVSGTVRDNANNPISGATVTCSSGCNNSPAASTTTAANGTYVFNNTTTKLSFGTNGPVTLKLTASKTGFNPATITLANVNNGDTLTGEDFTLTPATVDTTTAVTSSANPSAFGQSVSFTATVTPASGTTAPTGSIQFVVDGTNFGAPVTLVSGSATSQSTTTLSVGSHTVTANYTHTGNFNDSTGTLTGGQVVNKASITATVTANDKTYDGNTTATQKTCTLTGVLAGDANNVTCSASTLTFADKNVGAGKTVNVSGISLSGSAAGNYQLSSTTTTTTASITTAAITVTLTAQDKTYDGTTAEPNANMSCTLTGVLAADAANVTCTASAGTFNTKDVATANLVTATVTTAGSAAGNYTLGAAGTTMPSTSATATAHIKTAPITATLVAQDKIYDGTTAEPNANMSCTLTGVLAADAANVTCTASAGTFNTKDVATANLVTATVTTAGSAAGNYTLGAAGTTMPSTSATATAHIKTAPITATLVAQDKIYDGTTAEPNANMSCTLTGVLAADAANVTCTASAGTFNSKDVATANLVTATVTIGGNAAGNYTQGAAGTALASTSATATAHIKTAPITATLVAQDKTYDATTTEPNANMSCTLTGVLAADAGNVTCTASAGTFNTKDVATADLVTATVTIGGNAAGNYTLGASGTTMPSTSATATAHIKTAPITATLVAQDKTYDGTTTEPNGSMSCTLTGVFAADAVNVTCTASAGTFNTKDVATANLVTATVTISGTAAGNYTLGAAGTTMPSTSATATAHITTAPLTTTLVAQDKTYDGTATEPDGNMSCTFSGVVPADTSFVTCTPSNGSFNSSQVTLANQVTATVTLGGPAAADYTLGAAGTSVTSSSASATAHIKTAPLTATLTAQDKTYDGTTNEPDANMTCSLNGVLAADNSNVSCVASAGAFNTKDVATASQVSATVTLAGAGATNYTLGPAGSTTSSTAAVATAHIKTAPITATLTAQDKIYDGTATEPDANMSCTFTGVLPADSGYVACVASNGSFNTKDVASASQVTATVTISGAAAGDYTLGAAGTTTPSSSATATAHIKTAPLTATLTAQDKTYDGTATEPDANMTCSLAGVISPDAVICSPSNGSFDGSNVGGHTVTATVTISGAAVGDYTLGAAGTSVSSISKMASASITTRAITSTLKAQDKFYDSTKIEPDANMSCTLNGVLATDVPNVLCTATSGMFDGVNAGPHTVSATVTISGNAAADYTLGAAGTSLLSTTANANANINQRPITVTATTNSRVYDGTMLAAAIPAITTGNLAGTDTPNFTEAYTTRNVGTGLTLVPSGSVNDGNGGNNYMVTFVNNTTGVISQRAITVTATTDSKVFDGTTKSAKLPVVTSTYAPPIVSGDMGNFTQAFDSPNAGARTLVPSGSVIDGNGGANYAVSFVSVAGGITPAPTGTTVAAAPNPSTLGQSVMLTATVTNTNANTPVPTGSVQFVVDGSSYGAPVALNPSGMATASDAALAAGPHTIAANYINSDGNFTNSGNSLNGGATVQFGFLGLFSPYQPPSAGVAYKINSAIPLKWQYANNGGVVVNSSNANPVVIINVAPCSTGADGDVITVNDAGASGYQYDPTTNTWQFNWKTTGLGKGCYNIYIQSNLTNQKTGPFAIQLR